MSNPKKTAERTREHCVIVGAGLVGSLAASIMCNLGDYNVSVYEKRTEVKSDVTVDDRSINLALSARGLEALQLVGMHDWTLDNLALPMYGRLYHYGDGSESTQSYDSRYTSTLPPYSEGGRDGGDRLHINSVGRSLLNKGLIEKARETGATFHFDHTLLDLKKDAKTQKITLSFSSPAAKEVAVECDFVLACDGANSFVRKWLHAQGHIGQVKVDMIRHAYKEVTIPPHDGHFQMDPRYLHIWPCVDFMLIALPNPDRSFTATLFYPKEALEKLGDDPAATKALVTRHFPLLSKLYNVDAVRQLQRNPTGSLGTVKCSQYDWDGKVLLLGDAGHAMVPFYGQGMNAGFQDLTLLHNILRDKVVNAARNKCKGASPLQLAFAQYSKERVEDAHTICDLAAYNYWEMSSSVWSPWWRCKHWLISTIHAYFPKHTAFKPLYESVAFGCEPYSVAKKRHAFQNLVLDCGAVGGLFVIAGIAAVKAHTLLTK